MGAGRWLARRRLHPPTTASRMLALPRAIRQHARLPGAPPSWGQDVGLQDGVSTPPTTASRMLALPGAIRQHGRLSGAPPSWGQDVGLQDGASIPPARPAGCWRSQGRSVSMHDSRERRHLGGITLACKTAPPPPNHRQQDAGAPHRLPVPRVLSNHRTCAPRRTGKVGSPAA